MTNKLPSLTALMESVKKEFRKRYIRGVLPGWAGTEPTEAESWVEADQEELEGFLHQVILETVEVVGEEIIGNKKDVFDHEEIETGTLEAIKGYNQKIDEARARLSQLVTTTMDSLKEENNGSSM